jgi:hypothetical protein
MEVTVSDEPAGWRRCSACKRPIPFAADYYACSVSTCNRARTALAFCSVSCWEVHLPGANHREAWAVERKAPDAAEAARAASAEAAPRRRIVRPAATTAPPADELPREVLVVASRLKDYIRARSGCNTSEGVLEPLSDILRRICDEAIQNAQRAGRRTVLDRDVPKV